jgi:hypothetical protein
MMTWQLDAVESDATFWSELPSLTRATLKALRDATATNPLRTSQPASSRVSSTSVSSGASTCARELLAMVRAVPNRILLPLPVPTGSP